MSSPVEQGTVRDNFMQMISDAFAPKADVYEPEIVAAYFADRPDVFHELQERKHQVVLGRKGTGKTMVLKNMSLAAQLSQCIGMNADDSFHVPFVGFYVSLAEETQLRFGPERDADLAYVFGHWFDLVCLASTLETVSLLGNNPNVESRLTEFVTNISKVIGIQGITALVELATYCSDQVAAIQEKCNAMPDRAIRELKAFASAAPRLTSPATFFPVLGKHLVSLLSPIFNGEPKFFFLLDRFDEVNEIRQNVIKQTIQWQQGQTYFMRLGVAHPTLLHLDGISPPHDYRIVDIEHDPVSNSETYVEFCRRVLQKRFDGIRRNLGATADAPPSELIRFFDDASTCLPSRAFSAQLSALHSQSILQSSFWDQCADSEIDAFQNIVTADKRPQLCGIDQLAALSSGCVRVFVESAYNVIRHALLTQTNLVLTSGHVPSDVQDEAIRDETHKRYSQEFPTGLASVAPDQTDQETAKTLWKFWMKQFRQSLTTDRPALHMFEVISRSERSDFTESIDRAFSALEKLGLLSKLKGHDARTSIAFAVSRIFSPEFDLPPRLYGQLEISASQLESAVHPTRRRQSDGAQLVLNESIKCFYATGFRSHWENAVRDALRNSIFPALDIHYQDGEDFHSDSQMVGPSVQSFIDSTDFFLAEISDFNVNVCYEMGVAVALGRWCCRIRNKRHTSSPADKRIEAMLNGLKYKEYECSTSMLEHGKLIPSELESLQGAVSYYVKKFRELALHKRVKVNPFDGKVDLQHQVPPDEITVFVYADPESNAARLRTEFVKWLAEDLKVQPLTDPPKSLPESEALQYLRQALRSTHVVVDVTNKNRFAWFLVGFVTGRNGKVLVVYEKGTDSMIINYQGKAGHAEYGSLDELKHSVRQFVGE